MKLDDPSFSYRGETYYGRPAVKSSPYHWRVALYTFLGGLAGAAQAIGVLAEWTGIRHARRSGRHARFIAAAVGTVAGPVLLIADLHTPQRWYNMLRIFRPTSPMSIGSYVLTAFGAFSALSLVPFLRKVAQAPAAIAGAGMASYTPALLASTATPLWSAAPRALGAEFASAAFASGAAALLLGTPSAPLERITAVATVAYAGATVAVELEHRRMQVDRPLTEGKWGAVHKGGLALAVGVPLACFALNALLGSNGRRSQLGAASLLAGVFLSRLALFEAGNDSAREPRDYLRLTSKRHG